MSDDEEMARMTNKIASLRAELAAAKAERDTFAEDNRRHTETTNRMMDDLVTLRKRYDRLSTASRQAYAAAVTEINRLDASLAAKQDSWRKECDDADDVCELLGLRSDTYRTEGGSLNVPHIRALLRERDEKAQAELAAAKADAERYRWLREAPPHSVRWPRWRIEHWNGVWNPVQGSALDAAIDAAIAAKGE